MLVLYAGDLVEQAPVAEIFTRPVHPYTGGLLDSVPQVGQTKSEISLRAIPGQIPPLGERPSGCAFAPRCVLAIDKCTAQRPDLDAVNPAHAARCFRWPEIAAGEITARQEEQDIAVLSSTASSETVLQTEDVKVYFDMGRSFIDAVRRRPSAVVKAVDGVDLTLGRGRTLGIVGESGSGKTTLARAVVGLATRTGGEIDLLDIPLSADLSSRSVDTLRQLQFVFQNPDEALNPHMTVRQTLRRPLISLLDMSGDEADAQVPIMLAAVQLPASYAERFPNQLSGGEKQRVAIARAFAAAPDLLIADEAVSALDVSVQASVLNLLRDLQQDKNNALLFISHDLAVVGYLADQIAVMYLGQIVETADSARLFSLPMHPYTEALLSAVPHLDPDAGQDHIPLEGDVPSQINKPDGCPFHPRCPRFLGEICRSEVPAWQENEGGDRILCHIPLSDLQLMQSEVSDAKGDSAPVGQDD